MDEVLSYLGLGTPSSSSYFTGTALDTNVGTNPTAAAATSPVASTNNGTSWVTGLLNFANKALPVAQGVNNLVNQDNGTTAKNNTASATGAFTNTSSNLLILIGAAIVGVILLVLFLKK